jgi:hypothetical protein
MTTITRSASAMAIATWELHDTGLRIHPAEHRFVSAPGLRTSPERRPAPPNASHARAATRGAMPAQVRRGLAVLALLVIAVVASAVLLGSLGAPDAAAASGPLDAAVGAEITVVVGPGETAWDLVLPHVPAGANAQLFVSAVLERNGLEATSVQPGTVIRIPRA